MAKTKYPFTVSTAFPNGKVDSDRLTEEIDASSITIPLDHIFVHYTGRVVQTTCDIWFEDALLSVDQATLDSVVAAHSGEPLPPTVVFGDGYAVAEETSTTTTTSTEYQQKVQLNLIDVLAGNYKISWSYECLGSNQGQFMARVQVDDTDTIFSVDEDLRPSTGWRPSSGFGTVTLDAGNHTIDLDYCTSQTRGVSQIRRARLEIVGIGE